jgi:isochorismate hydrolase
MLRFGQNDVYSQVFVENAMAILREETHLSSIRQILPRIGQVRSTREVLAACTVAAG